MLIDFSKFPTNFKEVYQEKKPVVIKSAITPNKVSWDDINEIISRCDASSNDFRISFPDGNVPKNKYIENYINIGLYHKKIIKPVLYNYLKNGATLVANNIFNEPKFNDYAKELAQFTGQQTITSTYIAFGEKDSYREHWDTRDVYAIQLIGKKRWVIYEPSFIEPIYMQQSKDLEHEYPCPTTPYMDVILEPGDIFYIPRGWWHNPSPLGEATVHLAIGTFPAFAIDYIKWIFKHLPISIHARKSLDCYQKDQQTLSALGNFINDFLNNPENYQKFMDEHLAEQRIESRLKLETLGNVNTNSVSESSKIRLNVFRTESLNEDYLISSNGKIEFNSKTRPIFLYLISNPCCQMSEIHHEFNSYDKDELNNFIYKLAIQDILEII